MATVDVEGAPFWGTRLATSDIGGCKFRYAEPKFDVDHDEQYSVKQKTLVLAPIAALRFFWTFSYEYYQLVIPRSLGKVEFS